MEVWREPPTSRRLSFAGAATSSIRKIHYWSMESLCRIPIENGRAALGGRGEWPVRVAICPTGATCGKASIIGNG